MGDDRASVYTEGPNIIYRASSFGHCIRSLVLARKGYDPMPYPPGIQAVFAAGNDWEDRIIQHLRQPEIPGESLCFWSLMGFQREYDLELLPNRTIRVHIDALGKKFATSPIDSDIKPQHLYVHEYKSFGPDLMKRWLHSGLDEMPAYQYQLSIEMIATGLPGLMVVADKEESEKQQKDVLTYEVYETPPIQKGQLVRRLLAIDKAVKSDVLPDCPADVETGFCPWYKYHDDTATRIQGEIDNQLSDFVRRYRVLGKDLYLLKKEQDDIKEMLRKVLSLDTDYAVDSKTFGFYTSNREVWDIEALTAAAQAAGIDTSQYLSIKPIVSARNGK